MRGVNLDLVKSIQHDHSGCSRSFFVFLNGDGDEVAGRFSPDQQPQLPLEPNAAIAALDAVEHSTVM
ncbi:hypothetical protein [Bradyrhizobium sp. LjRoot220]|uniref:hypothetical protein n=1 Tax=Bradyrhizobium sp. LjRoot220 TaxID=3342284 RepID=UPI003F500824